MSAPLRKVELIRAIIARIKTQAPKYAVFPVGNFNDGIIKGFDLTKMVGVHFGGGQQLETVGSTRKTWRINVYVYQISWNKNDKILGVTDGDGILEQTDAIENILDNYIFPTELPKYICSANIDSYMETVSVAISNEMNKKLINRYFVWGGFQIIYELN